MLSVDEALERVRLACGALRARTEHVPLEAALGRVLAQDVRMDHAVPPFRRAAMDGFAVADEGWVGARYRVVGRVAAGEVPTGEVTAGGAGPGQAYRVMTGAPVPAGTTRVIPFEWTLEAGEEARVERRPHDETNVVEVGAHVAAGARVLAAGQRLDPGAIGVLAAAGVGVVPVARRPRAAVLATGSELVAVGARPGPAQIRNSNNPTLLAQVGRAGGEAFDLGVARDEPAALRAALERGLDHDLLLVSGGVSRGDLDLVPGVLAELGVGAVFHGWGVQPGGPLWFGTRPGVLVFALPGNPAASFVGFELLGAPTLEVLQGRPFDVRSRWRLPWGGSALGPHARTRVRPVRLGERDGAGLQALPLAWKGSGDPFGLAGSQALALVPPEGVEAGGLVPVLPLGPSA